VETCLNPKSLPLPFLLQPSDRAAASSRVGRRSPRPGRIRRVQTRRARAWRSELCSSALAPGCCSLMRAGGPQAAPPGSTRGSSASRALRGSRPNPVALPAPPHAWRAWARAAPWEPPRGALQVRVQALGVATRAWAPRQARGHCSTATAAANAPPRALPPAPRAI